MHFQRRLVPVGLLLAGAVVAGCTNASTTGPAPSVQSTPAPGSLGTQLVVIPGTAGTVSLPAIDGITPAFGIASGAPAGLTMSASESTGAPANAPAPSSLARKTAAAATGIVPFLYITSTFSAAVPAGIIASEILSFAAGLTPSGPDFYCEIDDVTTANGSKIATFGPFTVNGGSVTIVNGTGGTSPSFLANHTYLFQFYALPIPVPTPTPSPSPSAMPTATATATSTASATPSPTPSPTGPGTPVPAFNFTGPSASVASVTPPTLPAALVVPATGAAGYGTYAAHVSIQFGAETTTAPFALGAALGSTANDISPAAQFPFYTGSAATPIFYALLTTTAEVSFSQTPAITVSVSSFGSRNLCGLFVYANTGSSPYAWTLIPGAQANVTGNTVTIPAVVPPAGVTVDLQPNKTTLVFVGC